MDEVILISQDNLSNIIKPIISDIKTKINNKDISLPYTTQLSKSSYIHIDGDGTMFLNNNGEYIHISNLYEDNMDINKIYEIFNIIEHAEKWSVGYATMPTARQGLSSIEYNGKIYCIGGHTGMSTTVVEVYDTLSNTWTNTYANMPTARYDFGCIEYNGKIYCIGGYYYTNKVEVYDISSNTWTTSYAVMPTARQGLSSIEYNGKIYCIGGYNNSYKNIVEVYDILSNTWTTTYTTMPTARQSFGCVEYNGKIYCIGGSNSTGYLNKVEVYDILSNTWTTSYAVMSTARLRFGCVEYNGKIYCIGGYTSNSFTNIVEIYNIDSNTWGVGYNIPTFRSNFGCIEYNGKIYCIGGYKGTPSNIVEIDELPYNSFNITLPDVINTKLNKIITTGDGAKVFHNDGIYKTITPSYEIMTESTITSLIAELNAI